ncbi:MAG: AMP-binding protein [Clostridia bacterium]|nr:AMP-binding protein [Clostridia bacterium]
MTEANGYKPPFRPIPEKTAKDFLPEVGECNCYEYFRACTDRIGKDYPAFQTMGRDHMRSEFLKDIDAFADYYVNEMGLKPGDPYSVFMPNNIECMIAFFALNKIGCIVNFVHPLFPPELLKETLTYTKTKGVMMLDKYAPKYIGVAKELDLPVILCCPAAYAVDETKKLFIDIDDDAKKAIEGYESKVTSFTKILKDHDGKSVDGVKNNGEDTAVYMNGGGTTGQSRTIMLSSKALNTVVTNMAAQTYPHSDRTFQSSKIAALPMFHAFGLCAAALGTFDNGLKFIPMMRFDAEQFIDLMKKNPMYEIVGVPNMFRKLLASPNFAGEHLKYLDYAFSGGDYVPLDFLEKFNNIMKENGSNATLMPGYGLTEAGAVDVVNFPWATKPGTVGQSVPSNKIAVFDDDKNPLPTGEIGEIGISGGSLMKGYLMPDGRLGEGLYTDAEGTKWVFTGDMGFIDDEGFLHFSARKKRLIVISGYNVFPADIENLLEPLPFLKESCAVQGYDDNRKPIVRLFIVLADDADIEKLDEYKAEITAICSEKLSVFSVPRDIRVIDAIPRTRMEKVDFLKLTEVG